MSGGRPAARPRGLCRRHGWYAGNQMAFSSGEPLRPGFMTTSPLSMACTGHTSTHRWQPTHLSWSQEGLRFSSSQEMAW